MRLKDSRYEEIKEIVVNTFEKYDIKCIPVNGFEIASKMNTTVIPYSAYKKSTVDLMLMESEDGFSIKRFGKWYIFYNDDRLYGRVNNTIMHENGHIILGHTEDSELAEAEANFFAKYALAPPVLIHKLALTDIYQISEYFEISYEAAKNALSFYYKWLNYGGKYYKDYEIKLCNLFDIAL